MPPQSRPPSSPPSDDQTTSSYPLLPSYQSPYMPEPAPFRQYDPEQGRAHPQMPVPDPSPDAAHHPRNSSWDVFASGFHKLEHSYSEFDARNAHQAHLAFAQGDMPSNKFSRFYNYLLDVSIVTRWTLFIVPVMAILWIPGILGFTKFPNATVWGVKLIWWSIWLTVVWGGWWGSLAVAMILPHIARYTVGVVAVGARRYIDWLAALKRYIALFSWTLACWVSFQPLIITRKLPTATSGDGPILSLLAKLMFSFFLCAAILLVEKVAIHWIADNFHERSYAERIAEQKYALRVLVTLYQHSSDIPWRSDTLNAGHVHHKHMPGVNPRKFIKKALKGVRYAATTTTTALGNVASEIAGSSVLQPNSPHAVVKTALESANKSRLLARRLYYSFVKPGAESLIVDNIARFFPTPEDADAAFAIFDKDSNGDATRDEIEMACMEFHREQLSIEHSMRDLDSAVGRLDNILMSVYVVIALLIIAVALEAQLQTLITSAGTLVLGLSWLIGASLSEVLTSIIFLFVKHPYDVGDRVSFLTKEYTVKEIRLLSTVFLDIGSCSVQAPNSLLNTYLIQNMRRSPQMSEPFLFDVAYATSFADIEKVRELMLAFLTTERRDFLPVFDVVVVDIEEQAKMTLTADIRYRSNWQQLALKARRRNKWICALKDALKAAAVFGPTGDPDAPPPPAPYTLVPYEEVQAAGAKSAQAQAQAADGAQAARVPRADYALSDRNAVLLDESQDVFGEEDEMNMRVPHNVTAPSTPGPPQRQGPPAGPPAPTAVRIQMPEEIEMQSPHRR